MPITSSPGPPRGTAAPSLAASSSGPSPPGASRPGAWPRSTWSSTSRGRSSARRQQRHGRLGERVLPSAPTSRRRANESSCAEMVGSTAPPCVRRTTPRRSTSAKSRRAVIGEMPYWSSSTATVTAPCARNPLSNLSTARFGEHAGTVLLIVYVRLVSPPPLSQPIYGWFVKRTVVYAHRNEHEESPFALDSPGSLCFDRVLLFRGRSLKSTSNRQLLSQARQSSP